MRGRSRRVVVGSMLVLLLATGCAAVLGLDETTLRDEPLDGGAETGTPEAGVAPPGEDGAVMARLTATPAAIVVRRGASASLRIEVARAPGASRELTVSVADLPSGVSAAPAVVTAGATTATLTLSAAAGAPLGSARARVVVVDAPEIAPAEVTILVAGGAGTPDVTFDGDGFAIDASRGVASAFYAVAQQPDGKVVAGGLAGGPGPVPTGGWLLRRFTAAGVPDMEFNAAAATLPRDGELRALAVDAFGRIVCVGTSQAPNGGLPQLTVVRVLPSGAVDMGYAGGALRIPTLEAPTGSSGLAVAVDTDGSAYVAGVKADPGGETGIVLHIGPGGARDVAFDGGKLRTLSKTRLVGVAVEPGGAVTVGGTDTQNALSTYFLARLGRDGGLDPGFGTSGASSFAVSYRAFAFTRLADGALVLAGDQQGGGEGTYTAGVTTAGGLSVFARGFATANGAAFRAVAPVGDVGFVAAGHAAGPNGEARVARILADGGRDESFSPGGAVVLDQGGVANGSDLTLHAAAVQGDGRVLVAGNRTSAGAIVYRLFP